jgi:predicted cupin superfamily sugar epimerase
MDLTPAHSAAEVIERLALQPHPEGGFFRETFRAVRETQTSRGPRALATGILFLLTAGSSSRFHRLPSEELWLHQGGAPVDLILLPAAGEPAPETITLATPGCGPWPAEGGRSQAVVPGGVWQAARVASARPGADWGLVACVVVPGFDDADFELAGRDALQRAYPAHAALIRALT